MCLSSHSSSHFFFRSVPHPQSPPVSQPVSPCALRPPSGAASAPAAVRPATHAPLQVPHPVRLRGMSFRPLSWLCPTPDMRRRLEQGVACRESGQPESEGAAPLFVPGSRPRVFTSLVGGVEGLAKASPSPVQPARAAQRGAGEGKPGAPRLAGAQPTIAILAFPAYSRSRNPSFPLPRTPRIAQPAPQHGRPASTNRGQIHSRLRRTVGCIVPGRCIWDRQARGTIGGP